MGAGWKTHTFLENFIHLFTQQIFLSTYYVSDTAGFATIVKKDRHLSSFYRTCSQLENIYLY